MSRGALRDIGADSFRTRRSHWLESVFPPQNLSIKRRGCRTGLITLCTAASMVMSR